MGVRSQQGDLAELSRLFIQNYADFNGNYLLRKHQSNL